MAKKFQESFLRKFSGKSLLFSRKIPPEISQLTIIAHSRIPTASIIMHCAVVYTYNISALSTVLLMPVCQFDSFGGDHLHCAMLIVYDTRRDPEEL